MPGLNFFRGLSVGALFIAASVFNVFGQTNLPPEILATEATNHLNQEVVITETVVQLAVRPTVALLNLNRRYPNSPLTLVIRGSDTNKFPALETYLDKRVRVSGRLFDYQGRPEIALTSTNQIRILNDPEGVATPVTAPLAPPPPTALPDQPAGKVTTNPAPVVPATVKPDHAIWWIIGLFGVAVALLSVSVAFFWRRGSGRLNGRVPPASLAVRASSADDKASPLTVEEWKERALVAEAMAGRQGQILREKLMPELAEFAKQSLVQGLYAQRNALIETQIAAQRSLEELEARLTALQLPLPECIRAYERRIAELEKEVESQGEEVRELTRATLVLVRKKLEDVRSRERMPSRFN